jgi:hypothetical protein
MSIWDSDYVPLSRQGRRTIAGDSLRQAWPLVEERSRQETTIQPDASLACARSHYPSDVHIVSVQGREFILVGTAHVSQESTDLVGRCWARKSQTVSAWS